MKGRLIPDAKTVGFNNNNNFHKLNEIGLNKAYNNNNKIHVEGNTLYVAGTSNLKDIFDDLTKIPFYGNLKDSTRYNQAKTALDANPNITNLVGHSLGGSVILDIQKNNSKMTSTTYGAPVIQIGTKQGNRYRFPFDPISYLDNGAITVNKFNINPHSYSNYELN